MAVIYAADDRDPPSFDPIGVGEVRDYVWNWAAFLSADSDTIVAGAFAFSVEEDDGFVGDAALTYDTGVGVLTPAAPVLINTSTALRAWLWFLTPGRYTVSCTIRTTNGRSWTRRAYCPVYSL